jgi:hypothetical protein
MHFVPKGFKTSLSTDDNIITVLSAIQGEIPAKSNREIILLNLIKKFQSDGITEVG